MSGEYEKAITIEKAIQNVVGRRYLLPAIQRKFTWSTSQIEVLFDSIMRGYPINTFMFWEVTDSEVKANFRFYQFLEKYCERFNENNPDFDTKGHGNFHAVIDGQQRLTSLYIGLKGTYAYRLPRKWWPKTQDDSVLPPRKLYLNLAAPLNEELNEEMMSYEFSFLTKQDYEKTADIKSWFLVGDVLDFPKIETDDQVLDVVMNHLDKIGLSGNAYARKTLTRLYFAMRRDTLIHYYNETSQKIDHVLDIFIRTNHGGTPLSFSDLLMSIAIANWKKDARQQIDDLVDNVRFGSDMEFSINRDWILKAALALTDADVRFKVENFAGAQVSRIEREWDEIGACILETFRLIRSFGLNDASLRAKNAAIPIAYYLYHKGRDASTGTRGLFTTINRQALHIQERKLIRQWLHMSLLKGVFGGQSDTLLTNLRRIIKANLTDGNFPLSKIIKDYRGHSKDLIFDDDFIDRLLKTQKDDASCFSILALLMPDLDFTRALQKDHLHPEAAFKQNRLAECTFFEGKPELLNFYLNRENWNSIVNLHLLDESRNKSKQARPFAEWLKEQDGLNLDALLIPSDTPLEFESFPIFVEKRSQYLFDIFKELGKV
ncbi:DUF262 domain-containing protein [Burkholderia pseudomallei]|uniref:DUF262 domain-containing protein n=1 Tax=Burkholderia pseudomallei TaxID=28450 RepID=UPI000F4DFAE6|nr:DUF262 domain-containing protein [Burkholderia pseudomallei]RPE15425.1 DUF262 domain-containing protein [Burkholderia pseudomallei]RPE20046.1 DUF262 domain-containing protein [Burkholderia pseudomallei]RQS89233.1 DUF262 domain-containing protein [Burkholderia pseudomallei]RQZ48804.1 DUF262 domain-containing protein [Burkholderia pseudomallei]RSK62190.1 DUF262 domain-containing protein [Burkholderia pseudomallei]